MKKMLAGALIVVAGVFMLSVSSVMAQLPCTADFNCDQNVDATDVDTFLSQFGRNPFNDPCPDCYDSSCPCLNECPVAMCFVPDGLFSCLEAGGTGNCCCCVPIGSPYLTGVCTDFETCITLPPHYLYGPYECWF